MSVPRLGVALAVALFSSMLSVDPRVSAPPAPHRPPRPVITTFKRATPASAASVQALDDPPPAGLTVEIRRDPRGRGQNVVVSRAGQLVALGHGAMRAAGKDWASMRVEIQ